MRVAHVRDELCLGCGLCAANCPTKAIEVGSGRASVSEDRCRGCMSCAGHCPVGAVVSLSWGPVVKISREMNHLRREIEKLSVNLARIEDKQMSGGFQ